METCEIKGTGKTGNGKMGTGRSGTGKTRVRPAIAMGYGAMLVFLHVAPAWADGRSLESSANSAVSTAMTVAKVMCMLGFLVGGIAWNIPGLTHWAKRITGGAFVGAVCAFGGPAFIATIKSIFG